MSWLERIAQTLAPLSVERDNVRKMLDEWYYTGNVFDLERPIEDCELCGHPEIRYQFEIENENTGSELLVGSECIKRFRISAIDDFGARMGRDASRQKVDRDRTQLITDAKHKRVIDALVELSMHEEDFEIESFINYYCVREAFTPKQLKVVIWRLNKHGITFRNADFKMGMRRDREKGQLENMEGWQVKQLWPCMSASQRRWYTERFGQPA